MTSPKSRTAMRDEAAKKYSGLAQEDGVTSLWYVLNRAFREGWDARDKLDDEALKIALEALIYCSGVCEEDDGVSLVYRKCYRALSKISELRGENEKDK